MNAWNLLKRLEGLVVGDGFVREVAIPLSACIPTGASVAALSSNVIVIALAADNESITIPFQVPLDYDVSKDELAVVMTAELTTGNGSTNKIELDLDVVKRARPGEAAVDSLTPVSDSQNVAVTVEQYVFDLSGLSLKPGDVLSIEVDAQEDGTAVATVYGAAVRYRSDIVANTRAFRSDITKEITND